MIASWGTLAGVAIAALGGAAIGLERQWSGHATGAAAHFGGIRTFTLLGGLAGLSGMLWNLGFQVLAAVLLAAAAVLVLVGYAAASRRDIDATTEVAALVVLAAGVLAGTGRMAVASGVIALTSLLLVEKSRLHALARRLDDVEIRAGARFAVMATVILPLLPPGPYGPYESVRPRELWALVLFVSGLSFAGYAARRAIGPRHGTVVAGLLAGLVSSTSATLTFARTSRSQSEVAQPLAIGTVAACTVMFVRMAVIVTALNPALGLRVAPYLAAPFLSGALATVLGLRRDRTPPETPARELGNPLQFTAALQMAALFQAVLFAVRAMRSTWGGAGLLISGLVLGVTDTDALSLSMARVTEPASGLGVAAAALALGALSNTLLKLALVLGVSRGSFRRVAGAGIALMAIVAGATIWLLGTGS